MTYKDYKIEQDRTGYAPKEDKFHFYLVEDEYVTGYGESVEDCKRQIDEL